MPKNSKSHQTEILVALIGLAGIIAAALFANWGDIFGSGRSELSPKPGGELAEIENLPVTPGVAGLWRSADGAQFEFTQDATHFRFRKLDQPAGVIERGRGSIMGKSVRFYIAWRRGEARCVGDLTFAPDHGQATKIEAECDNGSTKFPLILYR